MYDSNVEIQELQVPSARRCKRVTIDCLRDYRCLIRVGERCLWGLLWRYGRGAGGETRPAIPGPHRLPEGLACVEDNCNDRSSRRCYIRVLGRDVSVTLHGHRRRRQRKETGETIQLPVSTPSLCPSSHVLATVPSPYRTWGTQEQGFGVEMREPTWTRHPGGSCI